MKIKEILIKKIPIHIGLGIILISILFYVGIYQKHMVYHFREIHFKNGEIIRDYFRTRFDGNLQRKHNGAYIIYAKESIKEEVVTFDEM